MRAVFTWASGDTFLASPEVAVYFNSLKMHVRAESFVFTNKMDDTMRRFLTAAGHVLVTCDQPDSIVRDRHLAFYKHMRDRIPDDARILCADCRDVVFQRDVFDYVERQWPSSRPYVLLCDEGMQHRDSAWNTTQQLKIVQKVKGFALDFRERQVLNGGFIYGIAEALRGYSFLLWATTLFADNVNDQAVMNYLDLHLRGDHTYRVASPETSAYAVTGEAIKHGLFHPTFQGGCIRHPATGEPYCAFHQWDRTQYKEDVLRRYC